ncbi:hypothetical protein D3C83_101150 [compost metagenome]
MTVTLGMPGIACRSFCTVRACRSDAPPGPDDETISTFLPGCHPCAFAAVAANAQQSMKAER